MMKSMAMSESCLYSTGAAADEDFVIVQAPMMAPSSSFGNPMQLVHNSYNGCFDEEADDDNDNDDNSYDYCEDVFALLQHHQDEADRDVVPSFLLVEERRGNYNNAFNSILNDSTSMTSSVFLAETAEPSMMDAPATCSSIAADADHHQEETTTAPSPLVLSEPLTLIVATTTTTKNRLRLLVEERIPNDDHSRQSSAEQCASDSPTYDDDDSSDAVSSQTELGSRNSTKNLASSANDNTGDAVAVLGIANVGEESPHNDEPLVSSEDEGGSSSGLASTDADSDSDVTRCSSTGCSTGTVDGPPPPPPTTTTSPHPPPNANAMIAIDGTRVSTMKFKRLSNKKRRRLQKVARKAAAATASTPATTILPPATSSATTATTAPTTILCSKESHQ
jgi:hypothetical protein